MGEKDTCCRAHNPSLRIKPFTNYVYSSSIWMNIASSDYIILTGDDLILIQATGYCWNNRWDVLWTYISLCLDLNLCTDDNLQNKYYDVAPGATALVQKQTSSRRATLGWTFIPHLQWANWQWLLPLVHPRFSAFFCTPSQSWVRACIFRQQNPLPMNPFN